MKLQPLQNSTHQKTAAATKQLQLQSNNGNPCKRATPLQNAVHNHDKIMHMLSSARAGTFAFTSS